MSGDVMRGLKPHAELFGWRSPNEVKLSVMSEFDRRYHKEFHEECGVECRVGDWQMDIYVEDTGQWEDRSLDPQAALGDISPVMKHTGAKIVAFYCDPCENGTLDVRVVFRGGTWDDVHPGTYECHSCHRKMEKHTGDCGRCQECEQKRVDSWHEWRGRHTSSKCQKCGEQVILDSDRAGAPVNPATGKGDVHWVECLKAHCPHYTGHKCETCGKPTFEWAEVKTCCDQQVRVPQRMRTSDGD